MIERKPRILAVDDTPANLRVVEAMLGPLGYEIVMARSGPEALEKMRTDPPDLVLSDIVMPGMTGYDLCRKIREDPATRFLPVVMVTASGDQERVQAIEAGADDFMAKPYNQVELRSRVASRIRLKRYHDTIERQKEELSRFLSPQVAALVSSAEGQQLLAGHRREATAVFCDLRGFTAFSDSAEPEEVLGMLRDYHAMMGALIVEHGGTLEHFAGDGLMVFFNDPVPQDDHVARAVRMAVAMRERFAPLAARWAKLGFELGLGVGIATGYATLGRIGFEGRYDYGMVGAAVIVASRLSSAAEANQILLNPRAHAAVDELVEAEEVGALALKGFARPIPTVNVVGLRSPAPVS